MDEQDFYELLSTPKSSSINEIKEAYKKAVLKYHPDKSSENGPLFERVQKAFSVLSSPETRRIYDHYGEEGVQEKFLEIDLVFRTMRFLQGLHGRREEVGQPLDLVVLRSVLANLCDLQYFFARPLFLPFGLGRDYLDVLQMPRPLAFLETIKVIYPISLSDRTSMKDLRGVIQTDDKIFAIAGHDIWKGMVADNSLSGTDAEDPVISNYLWLENLFTYFSMATEFAFEDELRVEVARLVPCWMHVASQIKFTDNHAYVRDGSSVNQMVTQLVENVVSGLSALLGGESGSDEDGDYDSEDGAEYDNENEIEDGNSDDGAAEEERKKRKADEAGLDDSGRPAKKINTNATVEVEPIESSDEEFDGPSESEEQPDYGESSEETPQGELEEEEASVEENTEDKARIAKTIFKTVEQFGMYMPDPDQDVLWFKRVLKDIRMVQIHEHPFWYPWGCPPLEVLVNKSMKGEDPHSRQVAENILKLYNNVVSEHEQK